MPPFNDLEYGATLRGLAPGQRMFGRFELVRILGRGGMGVVWLARDTQLQEDVALKFLPDELLGDAGAMEELRLETRRSRALTHQNIVRINEFFQEGRVAGISMEYVDGDTLSNLRCQEDRRCFEVDEIRDWMRQICEALSHAHEEAKIAHRDLKPANLMVTRGGKAKVTDFGISSSIQESTSRMTARSSSGTLLYMSPQQLMGEAPSSSDDVYALGATLYDLLTGKPPFYTGNVDLQIREKAPVRMSVRREQLEVRGMARIPEEWEATVGACLAKEAVDRPKSVRAVAARLGLSGAVPVAEEPVAECGKAAVGKSGAFWRKVAVLVLVAAAFWVFGVELPRREEKLQRKLAEAREKTVSDEGLRLAAEAIGEAWSAVRKKELRNLVGSAKRVFETLTKHPDPDLAYQGVAGLAAIEFLLSGSGLSEEADQALELIVAHGKITFTDNKLDISQVGFIDKTGKVITPLEWDGARPFSEGLAKVEKGGKYGFIDSTGKKAIPVEWDEATDFSEGLARVKKDGKYGFIDRRGRLAISLDWDSTTIFSEGFAGVRRGEKRGYIDCMGNLVVSLVWDGVGSFSEGLAKVSKGGKCGYIDRTGKVAIPLEWDDAQHFSEGLAEVKKGQKWGYIDRKGKVIIPIEWDGAWRFSEGLAAVTGGGKKGYIDRTGKVAIPLEWDGALHFSEGLAEVEKDKKWGYVDRTGKLIIPLLKEVWPLTKKGPFFSGSSVVATSGPTLPYIREVIFDKTGLVIWSSDGIGVGKYEPLKEVRDEVRAAKAASEHAHDVLDGVSVADLDDLSREEFKVPPAVKGVLVTAVEPDSIAASVGISPGCVIQEVNGRPISNADEAVRMSVEVQNDRQVLLRVYTRGDSRLLTLQGKP